MVLEPLGVYVGVLGPLFGQLVLFEDGVNRALWLAGGAVDALVRVDVEELGLVELRLVLGRVDAVDGADIDISDLLVGRTFARGEGMVI